MAIKKVFKSHIPSNNYITAKGRTCVFVAGRYETNHPDEVKELEEAINTAQVPFLFIDPDDSEVDTTLQDRMQKAKEEAVMRVLNEYNAEQEALKAAGVVQSKEPQVATQTAQTVAVGAVPANPGMSAATLLGVTTSQSLMGLQMQSDGK